MQNQKFLMIGFCLFFISAVALAMIEEYNFNNRLQVGEALSSKSVSIQGLATGGRFGYEHRGYSVQTTGLEENDYVTLGDGHTFLRTPFPKETQQLNGETLSLKYGVSGSKYHGTIPFTRTTRVFLCDGFVVIVDIHDMEIVFMQDGP